MLFENVEKLNTYITLKNGKINGQKKVLMRVVQFFKFVLLH